MSAGAILGGAGRALARGDALGALSLVGRADDVLGLTLRGIAYAQLGDLALARKALDRAATRARDPLARARIEAARVEIAMSDGDPAPAARAARASADDLARLGDTRNAAMQRLVLARAEVLLGRLAEARHVVDLVLRERQLPADVRAVACLAQAEIAIRAIAPTEARAALTRARGALSSAPNELLARALVALEAELSRPLARLEQRGVVRDADLFAIEAASSGQVFLVDACRRVAIAERATVPLARRPVLLALLFELADEGRHDAEGRGRGGPRVRAVRTGRRAWGDVRRQARVVRARQRARGVRSRDRDGRGSPRRARRRRHGLRWREPLPARRGRNSGHPPCGRPHSPQDGGPGKGEDSGMAYADGYLWMGQYRAAKIHQVDAKAGEAVKTLTSDRFVTGVSCVDGALWLGALDDEKTAELRRLAPDGTVEEILTVKDTTHIAGVESDREGGFWCGGTAGKVLRVRRRSPAKGKNS